MAQVLRLTGRVDPQDHPDRTAVRHQGELAPTSSLGKVPESPDTSRDSSPLSPSDSALSPARNCSGSTPIPIRLDRWMRSKLSASTARTPSRAVPLAAQSREEPDPYSFPASDHQGRDPLDW